MTASERLRAARGVPQRWRTDRRTFDRLVREALAALPEAFQERISNLAVVVEEWPAAEDAAVLSADEDGTDEDGALLGLYQGIPYGERESGYSMVVPDRVTIYRQPILSVCRSEAEAREEIRQTVVHEIGHYFGLGDDELP
jgi:predicted Zn-dependent protease with MMP-like domain